MTATALIVPVAYEPYAGAVPTGNMATAIGSEVTMTFNAATDKFAILFQARTTTVPDLVSFFVSGVSVAGTLGDIEATLENVTAGVPSGAVTNSATGTATISTTGAKTITGMAGTATLTVGTIYAVVLTAGLLWNRTLTIRQTIGSSQGGMGFPVLLTKDGISAWVFNTAQNLGWCIGLADSGGTYLQIPGLMGAYFADLLTFGSGTNPDERGNRWVQPVPQRCIGARILYTAGSIPGSNDDYALRLYDGGTTSPNLLAESGTLEGEAQGSYMAHNILFQSPVSLSAGTTYHLAVRAVGTDSVNLVRWDWPSNGALGGVLGTGFYATTSNNGGAFTDDNNSMYSVWPLFDTADDGSGGGGGGGIRMAGHGGLAA